MDGGFGDGGESSSREGARIENTSGLGFMPPPVEEEKDDLVGCFLGVQQSGDVNRLNSPPFWAGILGMAGVWMTWRYRRRHFPNKKR
jgi:hypothetical protein